MLLDFSPLGALGVNERELGELGVGDGLLGVSARPPRRPRGGGSKQGRGAVHRHAVLVPWPRRRRRRRRRMRVRRRPGERAAVLEEHLEHPAAASAAAAPFLVLVLVLLVLVAGHAGLPDDAEVGVEGEVVGERGAPEEDLRLRAAVPRPAPRRRVRQHRGDVP